MKNTLRDINGIEIKVGQTVRTQQMSGGVLPPGKPKTGVVEKAINSFGNGYLRIRYREKAQSFDSLIDLEGKINEVVNSNKSKQLLFGQDSGADRDENDFYATPAHANELFLNNFLQDHELDQVWEPACGSGDMADVIEDYLILDRSSDLIDRGYGETKDFLKYTEAYDGDIMTNPPFKVASGFVEKGLELLQKDRYLILLLRIQFAESKKRKHLYSSLCRIYVHSERIYCAKDGDFEKIKNGGSGMMYAWFVWKKGYEGETIIKWL